MKDIDKLDKKEIIEIANIFGLKTSNEVTHK